MSHYTSKIKKVDFKEITFVMFPTYDPLKRSKKRRAISEVQQSQVQKGNK